MFKRTLIVIVVLVSGGLLSACGGGKLAKDLTPIPTLPKGEEPTLVDALQGGGTAAAPTAEPSAGGGGQTDQAQLVTLGKDTFTSNCSGCHGAQDGAGPAFAGMAERAATRVAGMTAEEYIHQSVVDPGAFVVDGFPNIMPKDFSTQLSDQQINGLVAYIVAESGGGSTSGAASTPEATVAQAATAAPTAEATTESTEEATPEATEETVQSGDPANGETLFSQTCSGCHGAQDGAGPALTGIGERAATRVAGMTAADYLHQAIVDPSAYVVESFSNIMPKTFAGQFTDEQINDLVAYLLTQ